MDMNLPQECLDRWKNLFLQEIEKHCILYSTIGMSTDESPMWFQYKTIESESPMWFQYKTIESHKIEDGSSTFCFKFASSQRSDMQFFVPLEDDEWDLVAYKNHFSNELYNHFRDAKYDYIKTFHPKIYSQLK